MYRNGHIGAALIAYAPLVGVLVALGVVEVAVVGGVVTVSLAMLPDQDQRIPFVKHRGITHTIYFAVLVGLGLGIIGAAIGGTAGWLASIVLGAFGFTIGLLTILSHIAADALTPAGVEPFRNGREYSLDIANASNPVANYGLLALGVITVAITAAIGAGLYDLLQ